MHWRVIVPLQEVPLMEFPWKNVSNKSNLSTCMRYSSNKNRSSHFREKNQKGE